MSEKFLRAIDRYLNVLNPIDTIVESNFQIIFTILRKTNETFDPNFFP